MSDGALLTKAMVVNWALAELGLAASFTIDDQSSLGKDVAIFWPRVVGRCFGLHDWTFCRLTYRLTRQAAAPDTGYQYGFELPGNRIGQPVKLLSDPRCQTPVRETRIEGNTLSANEPDIWAVCKVPVDVKIWDWQWADAFAVALAGALAVPRTQDVELAADKERKAFGSPSEGGTGGMFGRLIAQDRASGPLGASMANEDPLTRGRRSDPWHGRY